MTLLRGRFFAGELTRYPLVGRLVGHLVGQRVTEYLETIASGFNRQGRLNMKRTDIERRERELRRSEKKAKVIQRKGENFKSKNQAGYYIEELYSLFFYNDDQIFNCTKEVQIVELIEKMKEDIQEKNWETILRKAIKKTGVAKKEEAFQELKGFLE